MEALHRFVARTPARLIAVGMPDAVGIGGSSTSPGTDQEYPNWRVPLADETGNPVLLDDLPGSDRVRGVARALAAETDDC